MASSSSSTTTSSSSSSSSSFQRRLQQEVAEQQHDDVVLEGPDSSRAVVALGASSSSSEEDVHTNDANQNDVSFCSVQSEVDAGGSFDTNDDGDDIDASGRRRIDTTSGTAAGTTTDPAASSSSHQQPPPQPRPPSNNKKSTKLSPNLRSLQTKKRPPLPEEQDRKRFVVRTVTPPNAAQVSERARASRFSPDFRTLFAYFSVRFLFLSVVDQGCLAAVLAAAYDYDEDVVLLVGRSTGTGGSPNRRRDRDAAVVEEALRAESMAYLSLSEHKSYYDDVEQENEDGDAALAAELYGDHSGAGNGSFEYSGNDNPKRTGPQQSSTGKSRGPSATPTTSSYRNALWRARNRHYKRRYDVFSQLLIESAELLQLEKSTARAFLPMLAKLLMPTTTTNEEASTSQRQRHQQQQHSLRRTTSAPIQQQHPASSARPHTGGHPPGRPPRSSTSSDTVTASHHHHINFQSQYSAPIEEFNNNTAGVDPWTHGRSTTTTPRRSTSTERSNSYHHPHRHSHSVGDIGDPTDYQQYATTTARTTVSATQDYVQEQIDRIEHLGPFLESMTAGAGFRCLAMFLLQHLLHSQQGYDARIRHAVKTLGVLLILHDEEQEDDEEEDGDTICSDGYTRDGTVGRRRQRNSSSTKLELVQKATRKFEALEHAIARRLMRLSREQQQRHAMIGGGRGSTARRQQQQQQRRSASSSSSVSAPSTRDQILRGLKIGGTAVVAGTLFAVTGGLAAPGIAAGVAAVAG